MSHPKEESVFVANTDLTGFSRLIAQKNEYEVFEFLDKYYEFIAEIIETSGGRVIKFMGDSCLAVFAEDLADVSVKAMLKLKNEGDAWLSQQDLPCRHYVKMHFGPVIIGELGSQKDKRVDVIGKTVNEMFVLRSHGFVMTPAVFRKLESETRQLFKKHTPAITYIPVGESHRD